MVLYVIPLICLNKYQLKNKYMYKLRNMLKFQFLNLKSLSQFKLNFLILDPSSLLYPFYLGISFL